MDVQNAWEHQEDIRQLMAGFYRLTQVRMSFFTRQREEIFGYPTGLCTFCSRLRQDPEMNRRCVCCDRQALDKAGRLEGVSVYTCHAGLTEAILAFRHNGRPTGYLMIGQFLSDQAAYPAGYPEELQSLYRRQPVLDPPRIQAAADIMEACVGYILYREWFHTLADTPVQRIQRYIDRHYTENLTLDGIAQALYMSRSALCQCVRRELGTTVNALIETRRMEAAKVCLAVPENTVLQAAEICGYEDANYFTRRFKKITGLTPTVYRESLLARTENAGGCIKQDRPECR